MLFRWHIHVLTQSWDWVVKIQQTFNDVRKTLSNISNASSPWNLKKDRILLLLWDRKKFSTVTGLSAVYTAVQYETHSTLLKAKSKIVYIRCCRIKFDIKYPTAISLLHSTYIGLKSSHTWWRGWKLDFVNLISHHTFNNMKYNVKNTSDRYSNSFSIFAL